MKYKFRTIIKSQYDYRVSVIIEDNNNNKIYEDIIIAKYDKNVGVVLLDFKYLEKVIPNDNIRRSLISNLKEYIKSHSTLSI